MFVKDVARVQVALLTPSADLINPDKNDQVIASFFLEQYLHACLSEWSEAIRKYMMSVAV